jgi:hypothetical protein
VAKREELEAALAQAEAGRVKLEAALAEAQAALINTVTDASKIDANTAEVRAKLDKARARCLQLRTALVRLRHSDSRALPRGPNSAPMVQSGNVEDIGASASWTSSQPRSKRIPSENVLSRDESRKRKPFHGLNNALTISQLVRETVGLLALVAAYLQYYYFDVQLQIMSLPSVTTLPFH